MLVGEILPLLDVFVLPFSSYFNNLGDGLQSLLDEIPIVPLRSVPLSLKFKSGILFQKENIAI